MYPINAGEIRVGIGPEVYLFLSIIILLCIKVGSRSVLDAVFKFKILLDHWWQFEFALNVEKNICLALLHHFRIGNRHCGVVKMIPLAVFGSKSCIMTRSSPKI